MPALRPADSETDMKKELIFPCIQIVLSLSSPVRSSWVVNCPKSADWECRNHDLCEVPEIAMDQPQKEKRKDGFKRGPLCDRCPSVYGASDNGTCHGCPSVAAHADLRAMRGMWHAMTDAGIPPEEICTGELWAG